MISAVRAVRTVVVDGSAVAPCAQEAIELRGSAAFPVAAASPDARFRAAGNQPDVIAIGG